MNKKSFLSLVLLFIFGLVSCDMQSSNKTPIPKSDNEFCISDYVNSIVKGREVQSFESEKINAVMLIILGRDEKVSFCTSTAISDRVLLTAAHCIKDALLIKVAYKTSAYCSSGFDIRTDTVSAEDFASHPEYVSDTYTSVNADVGLILLKQPIPHPYTVFKIHQNPEGRKSALYLYGYGITQTDESDSGVLRTTQVKYGDYYYYNNAVVISRNYQGGICSGDSGGPGMIFDGQQFQIAGISSYGEGPKSDVCAGTGHLALAYKYLPWIRTQMSLWDLYLGY